MPSLWGKRLDASRSRTVLLSISPVKLLQLFDNFCIQLGDCCSSAFSNATAYRVLWTLKILGFPESPTKTSNWEPSFSSSSACAQLHRKDPAKKLPLKSNCQFYQVLVGSILEFSIVFYLIPTSLLSLCATLSAMLVTVCVWGDRKNVDFFVGATDCWPCHSQWPHMPGCTQPCKECYQIKMLHVLKRAKISTSKRQPTFFVWKIV